MGDEAKTRLPLLTIIGLLATLAIGGFVLDTILWLLGRGRCSEHIDQDTRPPDHHGPTVEDCKAAGAETMAGDLRTKQCLGAEGQTNNIGKVELGTPSRETL